MNPWLIAVGGPVFIYIIYVAFVLWRRRNYL